MRSSVRSREPNVLKRAHIHSQIPIPQRSRLRLCESDEGRLCLICHVVTDYRRTHNPKVGGSSTNRIKLAGTCRLPFLAARHAGVTAPQVSNGNTLRTTTPFAARLRSDIAC